MKICQILKFVIEKKKLSNLDAEVLLCFVIQKNKAFIYSYPEFELSKIQGNKFKKFIKQRIKKKPVAYIIGKKEFYSLDFLINKNVLIPRPETEILVQESLKLLEKNKNIKNIIEIGTGSGCLIISLAKNIKNKKFYATDISKQALSIAKKNAENNNIKNKIKFIKSDLLKNLNINFTNSILIANLPYLPNKYKKQVSKDLFFEPQKALYAGKDGLFFISKLLKQISKLKNKPKYILLEFDSSQKNEIKKTVQKLLGKINIKFIKDLAGRNRVVIISF